MLSVPQYDLRYIDITVSKDIGKSTSGKVIGFDVSNIRLAGTWDTRGSQEPVAADKILFLFLRFFLVEFQHLSNSTPHPKMIALQ